MGNEGVRYDSIVIGSGQGGNPLCQQLASRGERVALIESHHLGGTCINTGCTPTKTMVASAQVAHYVRKASRWGVHANDPTVDLTAVVRRKNEVVEKFRSGWKHKFENEAKITLYRGAAQFVGSKQLQVGKDRLEASRIFIDTGAKPAIPHLLGLESVPYLTNETILDLENLPEHLLILGGGYVGLEFGQMFLRFGSRVTVLQSAAQILPREDTDIAAELHKSLEAEGLKIVLNTRATRVTEKDGSVTIEANLNGEPVSFVGSHLLIAAGRAPNTSPLNLEKTGVKTNQKGFIVVNDRLETTAEGIWALGDVNGGPAFTHISYNDYQIIYANLFDGKNLSTSSRLVPYAVYTDPTLGRVGMTEKEARRKGVKLKIGKVPMTNVARAIERSETDGVMKLVVDANNDRILGGAILAVEGGELVQVLSTLMLAEKPYTLLKGAIYIHPTLTEGFFGLMESVQPV